MSDQPPPTYDRERLAAQLRMQRQIEPEGGGFEGAAWQVGGRRLIALLVDGVFLMGIGRLVAFLAGGWLQPLGERGWWVGLAIAAAYFAIMDSSVAQGKSFGKRLLRIEVRRTDGGWLNPLAALLRFVPFAVIFVVLFGERFNDPADPMVWGTDLVALLILFAIGTFAVVHPQRRALQDLIGDSVVVRAEADFRLEKTSCAEPLLVFGVLALLTVIAVVALEFKAARNPVTAQLSQLRYELSKRAEIRNPQARLTIGFGGEWKPALTLAIDAFVPNVLSVVDEKRSANLAGALADVAVSAGPLPPMLDQIVVNLRSGFTIGLWREMQQSTHRFPAASRTAPRAAGEETVIYRTTPGKSRKAAPPPPGAAKGKAPAPKAKAPR